MNKNVDLSIADKYIIDGIEKSMQEYADQETQRLKAELEKVKAELEKKTNIQSDQYYDNLLRTYNADKSNK